MQYLLEDGILLLKANFSKWCKRYQWSQNIYRKGSKTKSDIILAALIIASTYPLSIGDSIHLSVTLKDAPTKNNKHSQSEKSRAYFNFAIFYRKDNGIGASMAFIHRSCLTHQFQNATTKCKYVKLRNILEQCLKWIVFNLTMHSSKTLWNRIYKQKVTKTWTTLITWLTPCSLSLMGIFVLPISLSFLCSCMKVLTPKAYRGCGRR